MTTAAMSVSASSALAPDGSAAPLLTCDTWQQAGLSEHVVHGFTTVAAGNLCDRQHEPRAVVAERRTTLLQHLGRPQAKWVSVRQVHGAQCVQVTSQASRTIEADGIWTTDPRAVLAVMVADCVPVLLAVRGGGAVAAVHAGWRGTALGIVGEMVQRLGAAGFAASDLVAAIGPCVGPCCYQVGDEVVAGLAAVTPHMDDVVLARDGGTFVDLAEANRQQLVAAGLSPAAVGRAGSCTVCSAGQFFSYRRDGAAAGRQVGLVGLGSASSQR